MAKCAARERSPALLESVELIVEVLDDVLPLGRQEFLLCHVGAIFDLLLESIQRSDFVVLAAVDRSIVARRAVGIVQAFALGAFARHRRVGAHRQEDHYRYAQDDFHGLPPKK